jgi:hypothetical protein
MASRPCKLDADLKGLWRVLLPSTPYPACGEPEKSDTAARVIVRNVTDRPDDAEPDADPGEQTLG